MHVHIITADNCRPPSYGFKYARGFLQNGCTVTHSNYRYLQLHRTSLTNKLLNKHLLSRVTKLAPDLVFVLKGETILPETIKKLNAEGIPTAVQVLDEYTGIYYPSGRIQAINEYEYTFSFDKQYARQLKKTNKNSYYLPVAADETLHKELIPWEQREEKYDLSFFGTYWKEREDALTKLSHYKLAINGNNWTKKCQVPTLKKSIIGKPLDASKTMADLNKSILLAHATKINMNNHHAQSIDEGLNYRLYELASTNSFQLTNHVKGIQHQYIPKKEIVTYHDEEEFKEKVAYYLEHPEERQRISERGHKRTLREHLYKHRMKNVVGIVRKK